MGIMPPKGAKWVNGVWVLPQSAQMDFASPLRNASRSRASTPIARGRGAAAAPVPVSGMASAAPAPPAPPPQPAQPAPAPAAQQRAPRAQAARVPTGRVATGRARGRISCVKLFNWNFQALSAVALVAVSLVCIPSVAKAFDVVSSVTLTMGGAAGQFAWATANLTEAVSSLVVSSTTSTLDLANEAWRGIDLVDIRAQAESGRLIIDDPAQLVEYLKSPAGASLLPVPDDSHSDGKPCD